MPTSNTAEAKEGCLYAIILILISPLAAMWKGYVLSILWAWFVVTTFHAPPLTIPAAIGVSYVVTLLVFYRHRTPKNQAPELDQFVESLVGAFLVPALSLGFGWIVNRWM